MPTSSGLNPWECGIVTFYIRYSSHPLSIIQPCLKKQLTTSGTSKYIIYSNCRVKIEGIHSKLSLWLDSNDLQLVDMVSLVGTLTPKQKAHHIRPSSILLSIQTSVQ
jgi:hypothetical protein